MADLVNLPSVSSSWAEGGTEEAIFVTRIYGLTRETQKTSDRDC